MRQAREQAGGAHLQEATIVQEGAHKADDVCAHDEDVTHVAVHNGVQVALPIPHLLRRSAGARIFQLRPAAAELSGTCNGVVEMPTCSPQATCPYAITSQVKPRKRHTVPLHPASLPCLNISEPLATQTLT